MEIGQHRLEGQTAHEERYLRLEGGGGDPKEGHEEEDGRDQQGQVERYPGTRQCRRARHAADPCRRRPKATARMISSPIAKKVTMDIAEP